MKAKTDPGRPRTFEPARISYKLVSLLVVAVIAGGWEVASVVYVGSLHNTGSPLVPGWERLATVALRGLSNYWKGGWGVESTQLGGKETYRGALFVIIANSWATLTRLAAGLAVGTLIGIGLGLAVSYSRWARRVAALPAHVLRTFPLLALIPLFSLWFGLSFTGVLVFVAYGVGAVMFAGTVNAVGNVSKLYVDNARTLGASRFQVYRDIVVPSIFPELRTTIMLSLGLSWSVVIGGEFLGAQTGLGYILIQSQDFALVDRMMIAGLLVAAYAILTYLLFERLTRRLLDWQP